MATTSRWRVWLGLIATSLLTAAVMLAPSSTSAALTVTITSTLDPAAVTVPPNTAITFSNADGARHRMRTTSGPAEFDTGNLDPGASFTVTLSALGTYSYRDERNTDVAAYLGQIVVSNTVATTVPGSPTTVAPPAPTSVGVSIGDRVFSPRSVTVAAGGTVTWTNNDGRAHTVTATDGSFDSGILNPGARWSHTFPTGGTFTYLCQLHPEMTGTVGVSSGGAPPPPPQTTVPPQTTLPPSTTPPPATTTLPPGSPPPTTASVMVMNNQFSPATVTIAVGGTVDWVNHDSVPHTVTADDGSFDSGILRLGNSFSRTFATAGSYAYHCDLHPEMTATVVVLAPGTTVPPPAASTTTVPGSPGATTTTPASPAAGGGSDGGSGSGGAPLPTAGSVSISGNRFAPSSITIAVGGTVTWTNRDAVPHTVTASDSSFDSGILRNGASWSRTFTTPGTYTYLCSLHPEMTATVTVATPGNPNPPVVTGGSHDAGSHHPTAQSTTSTAAGGATVGPTGPGSASVSMGNSQFQPASVTVGAGGTVTWTNTDAVPHTVTADDGSFDSDILMPGASFSHTFARPAIVPYRCILHSGMTGTVVVSDAPAALDGSQHTGEQAESVPSAAAVGQRQASPDRTISISGGTFPAVTVLAAGHSVTWVNDDVVDHDVIASDGSFDSGVLKPGERFTVTFDEPGVHPYTCDLHRHMGGTLIVMPADAAAIADGPTVSVTDTGFEPAELTVHQGDTVAWAFGGKLPHTVTAADGSFDSGILQPGATFIFTFDTLGSFHYSCILHPAMMGTITVVQGDVVIDPSAAGPGAEAASLVPVPPGAGAGPTSPDSARFSTPVVVGFGVAGGLVGAVLLALGVAAASRRWPRLAA